VKIRRARFEHIWSALASLPVNNHASSATAMATAAMDPNNDTLGERLRLYAEENFHDADFHDA